MKDIISVIIPVYNSEQYILDCIQSVQNQSYSNLEILLIDDGSVDGSREICKQLDCLDQRIHIFLQKHKGVSAARNTGIEVAKGKYLFFLDSDDMIHSELLETFYKLLEENGAVIATENYCWEAEDLYKLPEQVKCEDTSIENHMPGSCLDKKSMSGYRYLENQEMLWEFLMYGAQGGIGGKMIRHTALQSIRFDENLTVGEDTKFIYQLIAEGADAIILNQNWYYYRRHENNVSKVSTVNAYQSIYESMTYIGDYENKMGRKTNALCCEEYIMKCMLEWKALNRELCNYEVVKYLNRMMYAETKREGFSLTSWHNKKDFYLMLYSYPLFRLKRKLTQIWREKKNTWDHYKSEAAICNERKSAEKTKEEKIEKQAGKTGEEKIENRVEEKIEKVSIIIPMHNSESFIRRCVQSIVDQTYSNIEIIVIDDGSTDRSLEICKELSTLEHRIILFSQENKGVSATRNRGLDIATGKYVFFVDSDDAIHPLLIEELVQQAEEKHAEIALCEYSELYAVWMESVLDKISERDQRPQWKIIERTESEEWLHKKYYNSFMRVGMLISRETIGNLRYDQEMTYGKEALFFYSLLCKHQRIAYSEQEWYYHRLYSVKEEDYFVKLKNKDYFDIYRILRDKEYQRGHNSYALLWERRLLWMMRQEYSLAMGKNRKEESTIIRNQALNEERNALFKELAITARILFYCCFHHYTMYLMLRKPMILLDKSIWCIKMAIKTLKDRISE